MRGSRIDLAQADPKLLKGKWSGKPSKMIKMTKLAKRKKILWQQCSGLLRVKGGKSLRRLKKPLLSAAMFQKRRERCRCLLNDFRSHGNWIIIFSDEKTSTVDLVVSKQNERVVSFGKDISEVRNVSYDQASLESKMRVSSFCKKLTAELIMTLKYTAIKMWQSSTTLIMALPPWWNAVWIRK